MRCVSGLRDERRTWSGYGSFIQSLRLNAVQSIAKRERELKWRRAVVSSFYKEGDFAKQNSSARGGHDGHGVVLARKL
jgi:hypothetical protein